MDELDFNGYEYVDLGLPSGILWAKCNVGSNSESDYGLYFAWGETVGYKDASSGKSFSWSDYKYCNGSSTTLTKYNTSSTYGTVDNLTILEPSDDAASVNMGGSWRMPSNEEYQELRNNTTNTWTIVNGVNGILFTSKTNNNTLFFPASGYCSNGGVKGVGSGFSWSSSLDSSYPNYSWNFYFGSNGYGEGYDSRYLGCTVRGVIGNNSDTTTTTTTSSTTTTTTSTTTTSTTPSPESTTTTTTTSTTPLPESTTTTTTTSSTTPTPESTTTTTTTSSTTPSPSTSTTTTKSPTSSTVSGKRERRLYIFQTEEDYTQEKETLPKPNVSYVKSNKKINYVSIPKKETEVYEYVDLGLPSGIKWAKCNIGAEKESDYGLYFAWGETVGYKDANSGKSFGWGNYKYFDGSNYTLTKYNTSSSYGTVDNLTTLELSDDAATVNMGDKWRMPSNEEYQELVDNTTITWTTINGINGRLFTSKTNGHTLFLPEAGYCDSSYVSGVGSNGHYWSSSLYSNASNNAYYLYFNSDSCDIRYINRCYGYTVRGVMD